MNASASRPVSSPDFRWMSPLPRPAGTGWAQTAEVFLGVLLIVGLLSHTGALHAAELVQGPVVESVSATNALIRWATDVATGARVRYGTALTNLDQNVQGEVRAAHSVLLGSLRPGTKYFFTVGTARVPLATNSFITAGLASPPAAPPRTPVVGTPKTSGLTAFSPSRAPPTRETWGNIASLRDHFERHGPDFNSKDADDYARQAWVFLQRARAEGWPAKVDDEGVIRIFDPQSRAFAAYNRDGTTKTYFKPGSRDYFERQPGRPINAKNLKF
jgi:hypothetical protein